MEEAIRGIEGGANGLRLRVGMAALHAALFACELSTGSTGAGFAGFVWARRICC
jgi:hypothetical protein